MDFALRGWSSTLLHGRLSCPPGLPPQGLEILPCELLVKTMVACDSAAEIRSLISASPVALSCFRANRRWILRPICSIVETQLGALLPMATFAVRIQHLREERKNIGAHAIEFLIARVLGSLQASSPGGSAGTWPGSEIDPVTWQGSLAKLIRLTRLIFDTEAIITSYATEARERMQETPIRQVNPARDPLQLSTTERARLLETFFCLDIYHSVSFYNDEVSFQRTTSVLEFGFNSRIDTDTAMRTSHTMGNFDSIYDLILGRLSILLNGVDSGRFREERLVRIARVRGLLQFRVCSRHEQKHFILYLCSQGYPILVHVE